MPTLQVHILDPFSQAVRAVEITASLHWAFFERFYDREQR